MTQKLMILVDFIVYFAATEDNFLLLKDRIIKGSYIIVNDIKYELIPEILNQIKRFRIFLICHQLKSISIE